MAKVINTKIDDGILIFTFTNNEDEVFSSFKLNPTDINVAARAEELTEYFEQFKDSIQKVTSGKEMAELNKQIEQNQLSSWLRSIKRPVQRADHSDYCFRKWPGFRLHRSG